MPPIHNNSFPEPFSPPTPTPSVNNLKPGGFTLPKSREASEVNRAKINEGMAEKQLAQNMQSFMKLLITQIQNQDPMAPMDNTELVSQLVQFSSVEQALNTNKKLDELIALERTSQGIEAINFIGKIVNYKGDTLQYDGTNTEILYKADQDAPKVRVKISDHNNRLVQVETPPGNAGQHAIQIKGTDLDGRPLPHGVYVVEVEALDARGLPLYGKDGDPLRFPTFLSGRVTNVEKVKETPVLAMGSVQVPMEDIISFRAETLLTPPVVQTAASTPISSEKRLSHKITADVLKDLAASINPTF